MCLLGGADGADSLPDRNRPATRPREIRNGACPRPNSDLPWKRRSQESPASAVFVIGRPSWREPIKTRWGPIVCPALARPPGLLGPRRGIQNPGVRHPRDVTGSPANARHGTGGGFFLHGLFFRAFPPFQAVARPPLTPPRRGRCRRRRGAARAGAARPALAELGVRQALGIPVAFEKSYLFFPLTSERNTVVLRPQREARPAPQAGAETTNPVSKSEMQARPRSARVTDPAQLFPAARSRSPGAPPG